MTRPWPTAPRSLGSRLNYRSPMTDGPRLLGRKEAAAYCDIAESTFSMWVASHKMPPAIPGTRKWDRKAIDAKLDEISGLDTPTSRPGDAFERWKKRHRAKQDARAPYKPRLALRSQQQRVLLFMADNPDCQSTRSPALASERWRSSWRWAPSTKRVADIP